MPQQNNVILIKVPSIDAVNNFPVPAGNSVSFIHNSKPIMFIKTAPSSPFENPTVDVYKIVKMDGEYAEDKVIEPAYVTEDKFKSLEDKIKSLEERVANYESVYRKPKKWDKSRNSNSNSNDTNRESD